MASQGMTTRRRQRVPAFFALLATTTVPAARAFVPAGQGCLSTVQAGRFGARPAVATLANAAATPLHSRCRGGPAAGAAWAGRLRVYACTGAEGDAEAPEPELIPKSVGTGDGDAGATGASAAGGEAASAAAVPASGGGSGLGGLNGSKLAAVLPNKVMQKVVTDQDQLRHIRTEVLRKTQEMRKAVKAEDYPRAGELHKEVNALRLQDPLCRIEDALAEAVKSEEYQEAAKLRDAKDWLIKESPGNLIKVNRLLLLGPQGLDVITTDPEGLEVARFFSKEERREMKKTGQLQQPCWSPDGEKVAFTMLRLGQNKIEESRIMVFKETGEKLLACRVPSTPFFMMWTPDSSRLTYLSNVEGKQIQLAEVFLAPSRARPDKTRIRILDKGLPIFYAFTKARPREADLIVHNGDRGVHKLNLSTGERTMISRKSPMPSFMSPATHTMGGEDAVLIVEDGHLISARADGSIKKKLLPVRGFSAFSVSRDQERVVLSQQDLSTGYYSISILSGAGALDPASDVPVQQEEIPLDRVMMAFFISPDSKKVLLLASQATKQELAVARGTRRAGFQLQWVVYDITTKTVTPFPQFTPRPFFIKVYIPFFDMYAQVSNPWSPDSSAFCYVTAEGGYIQELPAADGEIPPPATQLSKNVEVASWSML